MTPLGPFLVKDIVNRPEGGNPNQPYAPALPNTVVPAKPQTSPTNAGEAPKPQDNVAPPASSNNSSDKIASKINMEEAESVSEELKKWKKAAINDLKQGKSFRDFQSDIIDHRTQKIIKDALKTVKTREEINQLFDPFINQEGKVVQSMLDLYEEINNVLRTTTSV